jgi:hypothetical protein
MIRPFELLVRAVGVPESREGLRPDQLHAAFLKEALRKPGCPLCRMLRDADRYYLKVFLREGKYDGRMLLRLLDSWGLCAGHAGALVYMEPVEHGDGLGTGTLYEWLLDQARNRLGDRRCIDRLYGWLLDDLASGPGPRDPCPACEAAEQYERASLGALRDLLHPLSGDPKLRAQVESGEGLCREHQVRAASRLEEGESLRLLVDAQARAWEELSRDLKEYVRKHDYRFSQEPKTPAEEQSWLRAVAGISGARCLSSSRTAVGGHDEPD